MAAKQDTNPYPSIDFKTVFPKSIFKYQQIDILNLLPSEFLTLEDYSLLTDKNKSQISKYWNAASDSRSHSNSIATNILNLAANGNHSFSSLSSIQTLLENVNEYLSGLPQKTAIDYAKYLTTLIERFIDGWKKKVSLYKGFHHLDIETIFTEDLEDLPTKLTCLTLIAATWFFWKNNSDTYPLSEDINIVKNLSRIIFPYRTLDHRTWISCDLENIRKMEMEKEKEKAHKKLQKAQEAYYKTHDYAMCGKLCREIISMGCVVPEEKGEAYYLLVKCRKDFNYKYTGYYNASNFMRQAISLGYQKAVEEWKVLHLDSLLYCPKPYNSINEYLIINSSNENKYSSTFLSTLPQEAKKDKVICTSSTDHLINTLAPSKPLLYLLFDEDFQKNFHDLLLILNQIKHWKSKSSKNEIIDWSGIQIYIRTKEEKYAPLIDTALKHMDGVTIQVYIIDDAKQTAQHLLSLHPLFYSIRSISKKNLNDNTKKYTLNLNILAGESNDLTAWLIREAFWMGCFIYKSLELNINVISPQAKMIESRLHAECSGIFDELPDSEHTSSVRFNFTELDPPGFQSTKVIDILDKYYAIGSSLNYFIVNIGDDTENLNKSIHLREWTIRKAITSNASINEIELPVITYYCEDPNIAHLSESMVVQQEDHGDSWFNNYSLIPFGMLTDSYSYENMTKGLFEKIARSVHLQYYGLYYGDDKEKIDEALESYYSRCYNRDSSQSIAFSIPYRLFQTTLRNTKDHIFPTGWNIENANVFTNKEAILEMATDFESCNNHEELIIYEQARWSRWMIARGWKKASPNEVINYMTAGNPKHQLYIAKLHGLIGSKNDITTLSEQMFEHYLSTGNLRFADKAETSNGRFVYTNKDFTKINETIIKETAKLLKTCLSQN